MAFVNTIVPAFYNDIDPFAAAWLRELIADGLIAPGEVDERSIEDITPDELRPFRQCHFCAGIGVWSLAARVAGIPDDAPLWTASFPCQPFSSAGKGEGFDDERHVWPAGHYLIEQCRPPVIVGEQVTGADGDAWLDLVSADLDATGYAFGAAETCAAGFGAPHERSRNYWVAQRLADPDAWVSEQFAREGAGSGEALGGRSLGQSARRGDVDRLAGGFLSEFTTTPSIYDGMADADAPERGAIEPRGDLVKWREAGRQKGPSDPKVIGRFDGDGRPGPVNGYWRDADWLRCRDEKWRPVGPGTFPLADAGAFRNRVGLLRGAGNAVTIGQAAGFLEAVVKALR